MHQPDAGVSEKQQAGQRRRFLQLTVAKRRRSVELPL